MTYNAAAAEQDDSASMTTSSVPGRPISQYADPFALEVHRAIDLRSPVGDGHGLPLLPLYIARAHDAQLHEIVQRAAEGVSQLAVLVGESSSGKTRACWEAVQALPAGWRLWHPFAPSRPEAALRDLDHVRPCTVVWLNEIQHYLLTATKALGERLAACLNSLVQDPERAPVLVLGTAWSEHWETLTTLPRQRETDHHAQARALLTGACTALFVPDRFTEADLRSLQAAASNDPRLAYVAEHAEQGHITQYLAGAPALIDRYRTGPPGAKALIEAAMDARRLGHGPALPLPLLEAAAQGYLTDHQRDLLSDDWLERSLAYAAAPLRGIRGPLTQIRPSRDHPAFAHPHYLLADYLEQHGRTARDITPAPAALWTALVDHASRSDLTALASPAKDRGLMRLAIQLWSAAADTGDSKACLEVAETLTQAGRADEALPWFQRGCELYSDTPEMGHPGLLFWARNNLAEAGYPELPWVGDTAWRTSVAANGGAWTLSGTAEQLRNEQGMEEALAWLRDAAETGNPAATIAAVKLLIEAGRVSDAHSWIQRAADSGRPETASEASLAGAEALKEAGRIDEALTWYQRATQSDHQVCALEAAYKAADMLNEAGRIDEALTWYQRVATATQLPEWLRDMPTGAAMDAAEMLQEVGRGDIPVWMRERAEAGDFLTMFAVSDVLEKAGKNDEMLAWFRECAERGDPLAMSTVARGLKNIYGRAEEADVWFRRALTCFQSVDGAQAWQHRLKEWGHDDQGLTALGLAVEILEDTGRAEEADAWLRDRAEAGDPTAAKELASRLRKAGNTAKALAWYQHAAEAGDHSVVTDIAQVLGEMGRIEQAIAWHQRAAEGQERSLSTYSVASLLEDAGRPQDVKRFKRNGLEPDGSLAADWAARPRWRLSDKLHRAAGGIRGGSLAHPRPESRQPRTGDV
ncbi:hypothetical protein AR457_40780 [Streptomyces agglomeratus]|uniref:tetratricopeptide repeat protein n=1 Tax=Streptomyces agglomeratus TaxID=285458 RepID=UPI000854AEFF|nr:hypothetical protein [Streptomyces agglomeratus]OEJ21775.1 hypothetical protein AR457_40780 [Streptomyces agglomeratus]